MFFASHSSRLLTRIAKFIAAISSCFFVYVIANSTYILGSKCLLLYLIIISFVSGSRVGSCL